MDIVFDKNWFKREQNRLLWLLNHSTYFRKDLGIQECDLPHNIPITEITPNSFSWGDRYFEKDGEWFLERTTDFRETNKFANRMYYAFYPVWNIAHKFDLSLANKFAPSLNFGFDTLTQYPGTISANSPVDGWVEHYYSIGSGVSWATIIAAAGVDADIASSNTTIIQIIADNTNSNWRLIKRSIYCFDTSSIGATPTISAATLSLYGSGKEDNATAIAPDINIYSAAPAATGGLAGGDYDSLGTTAFSSAITYANWDTAGYNAFTLNASGITNIAKTGISKFGARNANYDVAGTNPTWTSGGFHSLSGYYANNAGTTNDPKIVITYAVAAGPANLKSYNTNLKANIKTINTNAIANVKSLNGNT